MSQDEIEAEDESEEERVASSAVQLEEPVKEILRESWKQLQDR